MLLDFMSYLCLVTLRMAKRMAFITSGVNVTEKR